MREEVSCKFTNAVLAFLDARGWETAPIVEGLGVSETTLRDPDRWISFGVTRAFEDRVTEALGDPGAWRSIGFHAATSWSFGFVDILARLLGQPDHLYRAIPIHNRFMTRASHMRWLRFESGAGLLEAVPGRGYDWSPYVPHFLQGLLAGIPTYWDLPAAEVDVATARTPGSVDPKAIRLEVRWVSRKAPHRRLWDLLFGQPRLLRESMRELQAKALELEQRNQEIRALNATLEERVRERTEALERTAAEREKALRDRDDLLRAVTHDLGAPLRNIAGFAGVLERDQALQLGDQGRDRLARILRNTERMSGMLDSLLDLSRIKEERLRKRPVDLADLVRDVEERLSFELRARGMRIEIEGKLPTIVCEPSRLAQVFQNLIDNACKYAGGAENPVAWVGARDVGSHWELWVRDNGPGLASAEVATVFDVFRRGKRAVNGPDGKGVGLATVKTIAESYGGEAWAVSTPGRGVAFHFTLAKRELLDDASEDLDDPRRNAA